MYRSPFTEKARKTTPFKKKGSWAAGYHTGEDWVCDKSAALVSPISGTVLRNEYDKSYGNFVVIRTSDRKYVVLMAHMKSRSPLKVGAKVTAGDKVGTMGNTGNSYGAHLHIEVEKANIWHYNTKLLRPSLYINFNNYKSKQKKKTVELIKYKVATENGLKCRRTPAIKSNNTVGVLVNGMIVNVVKGYSKTADGYKWAKIKVGSEYFYVASKYLKKV